jgi:diguanylate cyclase (GGDEF)-like protein
MLTARARKFKLFFFVVLPLTIAVISMLANNFLMLQGIAESVNARDERRSLEAVQAAFEAANQRLAGTITDNANWDDAVVNTTGNIDPEWMRLTWGVGSGDVNYDIVYVLDADGRNLAAYRSGEIEGAAPEKIFGNDIFRLISGLDVKSEEYQTASSLMMTSYGLAAVAVGPILPSSESVAVPTGRPNLLLMARYMSKPVVDVIGRQFIIEDLSLQDAVNGKMASGAFHNRWNEVLGDAYWTPTNPGAEARKSYANSALFAIIALIVAMLPVSVFLANMLSRLQRKEAEANRAARVDSLSGLPNRLHLWEHLEACLTQAATEGLTLAYIDLDGFKFVNDAYDHDTGDKVLQAVAANISDITKGHAFLARLGGDEFAVVVTGPESTSQARTLASRIVESISSPLEIGQRVISIGASIGLAETSDPAMPAAELMRRADIAMYAAKDSGRNRYKMFQGSLDEKRTRSVEVAAKLRKLVTEGKFDHAYQPLVKSNGHRMTRVELLARWPQGQGEAYTPDVFIPVAEECGLINQLGMLLLDRAMAELSPYPGLGLSVNVSPTQLVNRRLARQIREMAAKHNFGLARLEIEVTESLLIKQPDIAKTVIRDLRDSGIRIALDDFGTGYASLGYLRQFQFDVIKLDRSLTQKIATDRDVQSVVQGTIMIARALSAEVVAEGVETEAEARLLQLAGCTHLQGFYFGRPQPLSAILLQHDAALKVAMPKSAA